ncbi:MAG TPA: energy transducer TonB, partial [Labilithrix sp.]|nr:energy transducer TonB [Labilithrix sp.]
MRGLRAIAAGLAVAAAIACGVQPSRAQGGSGVGGQPARRKVTKLPRLTRFVEAESPRAEAATVILTIEISATGVVTNVAVAESGGPDFDAAAVAAARQFVFEPAEVDDRPAPSKVTYRYAFVLKAPPEPAVPAPAPAPAPEP